MYRLLTEPDDMKGRPLWIAIIFLLLSYPERGQRNGDIAVIVAQGRGQVDYKSSSLPLAAFSCSL